METANFSGSVPSIESGVQYSLVLPAFATTLTDYHLPRGVLLDAEGTVTFKYANDTSDTLTLAAGVIYPVIGFTEITASSLSVTQIHILY